MDQVILSEEQWKNWWDRQSEANNEEDNPFSSLSPMLAKYIGKYVANKSARVLVTLCGNSPDLKWLAEQGYEVVGVEWSESAVLSLLNQQKLEYERTQNEKFVTITVKGELKLKFYVGDFLNFTNDVEKEFDFIWDTASLQTIPIVSRIPYSKIIMDHMKDDSTYMLSAMHFGEIRTWTENPYELSDAELAELYGEKCSMKTIEVENGEYGQERIIIFKLK